ncbi:hypothetical protein SERLA73DRAFT_77375 [Serpula lacrymans var. lacrymans S7.3]|uniref:WD40 repeat-like protein n=2 Tax=Serpula lacrymans var. lacrymans TaxID=341189 RepID=F8Q9T0_SERL3|nr:uncharacterized protein SERLADRAFT_442251 [Serpula lacrymans var. lacrymans S7.9]EGN95335.1 hypothetical protein SERLA73DRAFT_77375 [Serpula lacrymans var. lacrymans S7.3]EGO20868.1 hypothetical protein SERLADRAFT_442251 [Serpula lacrymans var. lacrymans S7.9]
MFRTGPSVTTRNIHDVASSLPGLSSSISRSENPWLDSRRKQTLLNLLDIITELNHDGALSPENDGVQVPSFEDGRDAPTVDERLQIAGAETFNKFEKRIENLDKELRNFANAARQLGSSVGILSSAFRLRERLTKILYLFRFNAACLFPRKVQRQSKESLINPNLMDRRRKATRRTSPPLSGKLMSDEALEPEKFPEQFEKFAADVATFLNCLNEFPEFTDEAVNASMRSFEGDLKYWSCCLKEYKSQFRLSAVQRYIHDLTSEIGDHIDNITVTLSMFIEIGVPTIRFAQQHAAANLLNLSTVATFFSAVTATTLQFSYGTTGSLLADTVNAFWFSSLVFSIAAAVNSLLGLTWKQAMYRSPGHRVPWWVLIWIKRSPLVFLVISVACFSAGLMLFTYSSNQGRVTNTITTLFTAVTSFGLAAVSAWFASERWTFVHHRGHMWLEDVILNATNRLFELQAVVNIKKALNWGQHRVCAAGSSLKQLPSKAASLLTFGKEGSDAGTEGTLPFTHPIGSPPSPSLIRDMSFSTETSERRMSCDSEESGVSSAPFNARERLVAAIRKVIMLQATTSAASGRYPPGDRHRTLSESRTEPMSPSRFSDPMAAFRGSRSMAVAPRLKAMRVTQEVPAHQALVRHLQFSPNGKYLATSSWDRTSIIFRVGDPFTSHRILVHTKGFIGQVAWSPSGNMVLTKLNRAIKIWTEDGVCKKTIDRPRTVQSIAWLPKGDAIVSVEVNEFIKMDQVNKIYESRVEGSVVVKLDLHGKVLDTYQFGRIKLNSVAVHPDCRRLIGVGPLLSSPSGLQPSKSRVEKRVIVYNMETKQSEHRSQTPVFNDVRDITIAKKGSVALISYEHQSPPQLWKLELVRDKEHKLSSILRPSLRLTYMPAKGPVDFSGPSYFGGQDDQLVLCAGKAGDIHIWERDTAALLHHIRPQGPSGDVTCIAWNYFADMQFMFATGSHDGTVRVWTTPDDTRPEDSPVALLTGFPPSRSPSVVSRDNRREANVIDPTSAGSPRERRPHVEIKVS